MDTNPKAAIGEVVVTSGGKMMTIVGGEYSDTNGEWRYGCSDYIDGQNSTVNYITDHEIVAVFRDGTWI